MYVKRNPQSISPPQLGVLLQVKDAHQNAGRVLYLILLPIVFDMLFFNFQGGIAKNLQHRVVKPF